MGEFCDVERDGRLLIVTINRPEVMNAVHPKANAELASVFDEFCADDGLWVAILTGTGDRAFCAGNDLKFQAAGGVITVPETGFGGLTSRTDNSKPIIAAVNGVAMGGGFEIALACDLIVASENAVFALPEPRVGLAAMAGGIHRLPRQIPLKHAMGMLLTGRRVSAEEGARLGFVNEVVPHGELMAAARRWAAQILECAPLSVRASKQAAMQGLEKASLHDAMFLPVHRGRGDVRLVGLHRRSHGVRTKAQTEVEGRIAKTQEREPRGSFTAVFAVLRPVVVLSLLVGSASPIASCKGSTEAPRAAVTPTVVDVPATDSPEVAEADAAPRRRRIVRARIPTRIPTTSSVSGTARSTGPQAFSTWEILSDGAFNGVITTGPASSCSVAGSVRFARGYLILEMTYNECDPNGERVIRRKMLYAELNEFRTADPGEPRRDRHHPGRRCQRDPSGPIAERTLGRAISESPRGSRRSPRPFTCRSGCQPRRARAARGTGPSRAPTPIARTASESPPVVSSRESSASGIRAPHIAVKRLLCARLVIGMMPATMGLRDARLSGSVDDAKKSSLSKNSWVMRKSAPASTLTFRCARSASGLAASGWVSG